MPPDCWQMMACHVNTLRLRQNGCYFADYIFRVIFLNENWCILIQMSLKFVPKGSVDNKPAFGSGNGLSPVRCQAIAWTNDGSFHWCHMASRGHKELNVHVRSHMINFTVGSCWRVSHSVCFTLYSVFLYSIHQLVTYRHIGSEKK